MTNKYSELSDFEVNQLIAEILGYRYSCDDQRGAILVESISSSYGGFKTIILSKNYCFDYSDAFKLMIDNKITLQPVISSNKWTAIGAFIFNKDGSGACASAVNENPCRAIAECYLLMKDAENSNDK